MISHFIAEQNNKQSLTPLSVRKWGMTIFYFVGTTALNCGITWVVFVDLVLQNHLLIAIWCRLPNRTYIIEHEWSKCTRVFISVPVRVRRNSSSHSHTMMSWYIFVSTQLGRTRFSFVVLLSVSVLLNVIIPFCFERYKKVNEHKTRGNFKQQFLGKKNRDNNYKALFIISFRSESSALIQYFNIFISSVYDRYE